MICIGDSLTRGMLGHSYIEYCERPSEYCERPGGYCERPGEYCERPGGYCERPGGYCEQPGGYCERPGEEAAKILNRGVNGDTTRCAFERLEEYLAKPLYDDQTLYVIAIGTNDILLPYLSHLSSAWKAETSLRCRIKKCINDDDVFRQEYEKYFMAICSYNSEHPQNCKAMITIGLPYIELKDYPLYEVYRHNAIISELSAKYGVPFINICDIQRDAAVSAKADGTATATATATAADGTADATGTATAADGTADAIGTATAADGTADAIETATAAVYTWKHKNLIRLIANLAMLICPSVKDMLSRKRGLKLTVDGVHYNSLSAELLGRALADTQGREPRRTEEV